MLATRWLQALSWVNAGIFSDFHRKQTWEQCRITFQTARDALYAGGQEGALANAYMQVEDREVFLYGILGQAPDDVVSHGDRALQAMRLSRKKHLIVFAVLGGMGLLGAIVLAALSHSGGLFVFFMFLLAVVVGGPAASKLPNTSRNVHAADLHRRNLHACLHEWHTLHTSDGGFAMLARVRSEHPLLLQPPVNDAAGSPASSRPQVVERETVERQVVVGRCKYCSQLTPIDLTRCRTCGAEGPL